MTPFHKRLASAAIVGGLLLCAARADAQFGGPINPYTPNGSVPLTPNPFAINPYAPGGLGYPGTGYGWNPGELGGILFGQADMLRRAYDEVTAAGCRLVNLDCVVAAQRPKLSPHKERIIARIAEILGVTTNQINLKAKTGEGAGPVGREETIEARCVALVESTA